VGLLLNYGKNIWAHFMSGGIIEVQTISNLPLGASPTVVFTWDTTGVALGSYFIGAFAVPVPGETDKTDNTFGDGLVTICPIEATINIDPDTLNVKSNGQWISAYIELPEGYDVANIDLATVLLIYDSFDLSAENDPQYGFVTDPQSYLLDHDEDGIIEHLVKFDRYALRDYLGEADLTDGDKFYEVTLVVAGEVGGNAFEGSDTITVIKK